MRHYDQTTFALISVCSAVRAKGEFRTRARHQVGGRSQSLLRTCIGAYLADRKHSRTCALLPRPVNFGLLGSLYVPQRKQTVSYRTLAGCSLIQAC